MTKPRIAHTRSQPPAPASIFLRYVGTDLPASAVAQAARQRSDLPVAIAEPVTSSDADYCLIDGTLAVAGELPPSVAPPEPGLGYAGFSGAQRAALHAWIGNPALPAPPAFQQLLLANAEVRMLEGGERAATAHKLLLPLAAAQPWQGHAGLARTLMLSFWLRQDGAGLVQWLATSEMPGELWRAALGLQALLARPLDAAELLPLASAWNLPVVENPAVLRLRLDSLRTVLGQEPLAYALARLGEAAHAPVPWRCQHRDLRLALPQPNLRPLLDPLLRELLSMADIEEETPEAAGPNEAPDLPQVEGDEQQGDKRAKKRRQAANPPNDKVHLILEFGASRWDVFGYVVRQAQKQPGFQQIMDENRHMVYRVPFRRSEMRHFWQIWGYVQNWASTRVYSDGRELDKWQIYPYSQYLR